MKLKSLICVFIIAILQLAAFAEDAPVRALVVGVTRYEDGRAREGGTNSTQGVYDALTHAFNAQQGYDCEMALDLSKDELAVKISERFSDMPLDGVSLIYINSHGGAKDGENWIETASGEHITPLELKQMTDPIPGKVILLIDCCNSGGFIGEESREEFSNAFTVNAFASSKYTVCVSCCLDENSYRVASGSTDELNLATVFSRALCEGLGWDLIKDSPTSLKADADGDRAVTFSELVAYTRRRCMYYLSSSSVTQTVACYPESSPHILAERY